MIDRMKFILRWYIIFVNLLDRYESLHDELTITGDTTSKKPECSNVEISAITAALAHRARIVRTSAK
jgi:hypothetical protein